MGAAQPGLDDHGVFGVVELDQLVALVGEGAAGLLVVGGDLLGPVVDVAGRDDLVAGVLEGVERDVELVPVLGLHVLDDDLLAFLAQISSGIGMSRPYTGRCWALRRGALNPRPA